jgi:phospholipid/cholesterol/gamma-HCH transport system permease protein
MHKFLVDSLAHIGSRTLAHFEKMGLAGQFLAKSLFAIFPLGRFFRLMVTQMHFVGVLSLLVILVSGLFIGMVVALQGYHTLSQFGAEQALGQLLALSITRELGPVVTALLFAGRAGTALTAEVGLMRSTEQLSSLEMMAVSPIHYVVAPRLWSGLFCLPILTIIFNLIAIYGGYLVGVVWLDLDAGSFWSAMQDSVDFRLDVVNGLLKSCVFGFISLWVALYQGYFSVPSAEGVGRATTKGVVFASLLILGLDFILTAMMMEGW